MGGEVSFEVDLPGVDGTSYGTGIFVGNKTLDIAYIEVKDNSRIPRGRYEVPRTKITAIEAILDLDTLVENPDGSISARSVDEPDEVELTKAQIDALAQYTDASYWNINKHLREGAPLTEDDVKDLETLLSLINKSSISQDKVLYRGRAIKSQERLDAINALKPGDAITDRGIMSTSASSNRANFYAEMNLDDVLGRIMFEIEAKAGQKAFEVPDQYSSYGSSESEVLLPPNSRLEVIEVLAPVDGMKTIRLRLVDSEAVSTDKPGVIDVVNEEAAKERIEPGFTNWVPSVEELVNSAVGEYDEDTGETTNSVVDPSRGNAIHAVFVEAAGFNGKPTLLSQEEFDALEGETIYRAVSSVRQVVDFKESPMQYAGEGTYGNGTYASNNKKTTEMYAGDTGNDPEKIAAHTLTMKLLPTANVLSFEDNEALNSYANNLKREFVQQYKDSGANPGQVHNIEFNLNNSGDWTALAIMNGVDAVRFKVNSNVKDEVYTIIFNREKVAINEGP
jgi:hypothetical protein